MKSLSRLVLFAKTDNEKEKKENVALHHYHTFLTNVDRV
jgi:hypothetical protein